MAKRIVAIVGRPNVGKSTFFNRCVGSRHSIVDDSPGVTRDRLYREAEWTGHEFVLIDTGGIITESQEPMANQVVDQVQLAVEEADVIVFMVDGKEGPTGADEDVANMLRRSKKPILLAVNKVDSKKDEMSVPEFYSLGLGEPYALSAMRGTGGVGDLLDLIVSHFPEAKRQEEADTPAPGEEDSESEERTGPISIAIVGKPNVGKSSILNVLCGEDRTIVSPDSGTTRDAIDTRIKYHGEEYILIDTAGIRRKSKVKYGVESFSVARSLRAISQADVVVHVLDVSEDISEQDQRIAGKIEEAGRAVVIVMNKWDLKDDKSSSAMNKILDEVKAELRHVGYAEVVFTSALNKVRVQKILDAAVKAYSETTRRISTSLVNQIVNESVALVPPPSGKRGKRLKIYYATQVSASPPTFVLFVNDEHLLPKNYKSYLERKLRESFGFYGTPIRIAARSKSKTARSFKS